MTRTNTTDRTSFSRPGNVTYTFGQVPFKPYVITITLPPSSNWTSGLHWHETHTEYLQVIKGAALVTVDDQTRIYKPKDGIITVPKFARHEWQRASPSFKEGEFEDVHDAVVREWTDPADGMKEVFFRNLNSVIKEETKDGPPKQEWWLTLQLFVIFFGMDNYPVLMRGLPPRLSGLLTHFVLWLAALLGRKWELKSAYEEYTPQGLIEIEDKKGK